MNVRGKVVRRRFGAGSKSDHSGVYLETDKGPAYLLRRRDGNPFEDPTLDALVGKSIEGSGTVQGYSFYLSKWREV